MYIRERTEREHVLFISFLPRPVCARKNMKSRLSVVYSRVRRLFVYIRAPVGSGYGCGGDGIETV